MNGTSQRSKNQHNLNRLLPFVKCKLALMFYIDLVNPQKLVCYRVKQYDGRWLCENNSFRNCNHTFRNIYDIDIEWNRSDNWSNNFIFRFNGISSRLFGQPWKIITLIYRLDNKIILLYLEQCKKLVIDGTKPLEQIINSLIEVVV